MLVDEVVVHAKTLIWPLRHLVQGLEFTNGQLHVFVTVDVYWSSCCANTLSVGICRMAAYYACPRLLANLETCSWPIQKIFTVEIFDVLPERRFQKNA